MNKNSKYTQKHKEPMKNATINLPKHYIRTIDTLNDNRSEFLRDALHHFLKRELKIFNKFKGLDVEKMENTIITADFPIKDLEIIDILTTNQIWFSRSELIRNAVREALIKQKIKKEEVHEKLEFNIIGEA